MPVSLQLSFAGEDSLQDPAPHLTIKHNVKLSLQPTPVPPCLLVVRSQPVEGVPGGGGGVVLEGEGEATGELAGPVLPPTDLSQLGSSQHQGGLLGKVE